MTSTKLNVRKTCSYERVLKFHFWVTLWNLVPLGLAILNHTAFDWPADRALPLFPERAQTIEYANLSKLSGDEQGLLVTLQGLVNRRQPRLYFYWPEGLQSDYDGSNEAWLQQLNLNDSVDFSATPLDLIDKHRSEINGAIVYDNSVRDTINLASTIAGIHGAVVATEELAQRFNIPIIEDLRGRFKDKYEVYEYALQNVWPNVTGRLITAISPISTIPYPDRTWATLLRVESPISDKSNNATYEVDLSVFLNPSGSVHVNITDAYPDDGSGPSVWHVTVIADGSQVIADFQPGTDAEDTFLFDSGGSHLASYPGGWRFADGQAGMTYKFDYPPGSEQLSIFLTMWNQYQVEATASPPGYQKLNPVFRDYIVATAAPCVWLTSNKAAEAALLDKILHALQPNAAYLGWFPNGDEMAGVTQTAKHGVYVAATDWFYNPTFFSGAKPTDQTNKSKPHTIPRQSYPANTTKVYLSLTYLEGDNIQYNQHRMYVHWNDPARGSVPIGWTISPLLRDIAPAMPSYYQNTATDNDFLVAGPDGAGYTYPVNWPADELSLFLAQTGEYLRATRTDEVLFMYNRVNDTDVPLTPELTVAFRDAVGADRLRGILYGDFVSYAEELSMNVTGGFAVTNLVSLGDEWEGAATLRNISARWNGSRPLFIAGAVNAWDMKPSNVSRMVERLGPGFQVVRPDEWFEMLGEL